MAQSRRQIHGLWPGLLATELSKYIARLPAELSGLLPFTSGHTRTPSTGGTPDSLLLHRQERQEAGYTPDTDPQQGSTHAASVGRPGIAGHLMQVGRLMGAACAVRDWMPCCCGLLPGLACRACKRQPAPPTMPFGHRSLQLPTLQAVTLPVSFYSARRWAPPLPGTCIPLLSSSCSFHQAHHTHSRAPAA